MRNIFLGVFAALAFCQAGFIFGYWLKGAQDTYVEKLDVVKIGGKSAG